MAPCVARDRWHRAWPAIDGTVRGPRSMAPCVATARVSEVFSDDLHGTNRHKRCRRESHSSGVSPVRRFPVSVVRGPWGVRGRDRWHRAWPGKGLNVKTISKRCAIDGTVRGPRAVSDRSARSLRRFLPKLIRASLWAVFAAYRVFDPRFVSCWPMFADLSVVKRRCAPCLLKLCFGLRETRNRIQKNDPSRTICSILFF